MEFNPYFLVTVFSTYTGEAVDEGTVEAVNLGDWLSYQLLNRGFGIRYELKPLTAAQRDSA